MSVPLTVCPSGTVSGTVSPAPAVPPGVYHTDKRQVRAVSVRLSLCLSVCPCGAVHRGATVDGRTDIPAGTGADISRERAQRAIAQRTWDRVR